MTRPLWYDRKGKPITMEQWAAGRGGRQRVALTKVGDGIEVSTVYLGLDHNPLGIGPPLIFETMAFVKLDPPQEVSFTFAGVFHHYVKQSEEGGCWRWPTEEAALAGHDQIVAELRSQFEVNTDA